MKITPLGAAGGEVTGSCYSVQTEHPQQKFPLPSRSPAMGEAIEL